MTWVFIIRKVIIKSLTSYGQLIPALGHHNWVLSLQGESSVTASGLLISAPALQRSTFGSWLMVKIQKIRRKSVDCKGHAFSEIGRFCGDWSSSHDNIFDIIRKSFRPAWKDSWRQGKSRQFHQQGLPQGYYSELYMQSEKKTEPFKKLK